MRGGLTWCRQGSQVTIRGYVRDKSGGPFLQITPANPMHHFRDRRSRCVIRYSSEVRLSRCAHVGNVRLIVVPRVRESDTKSGRWFTPCHRVTRYPPPLCACVYIRARVCVITAFSRARSAAALGRRARVRETAWDPDRKRAVRRYGIKDAEP